MSERNTSTLLDLLRKYQVEIPVIQRDYAQGRRNVHAWTVRSNLLKDMKKALQEKVPLDLSFVYGKTADGKFIPVDGQQRLTTLFLLHLYAFHKDASKTELLRNFTYETRITSREFFKELIRHREPVFQGSQKPSCEIEDSEWFIQSWRRDPTVDSVLVMLDAIVNTFPDWKDLSEKLSDTDPVLITFQFQDMEELGMEDSLYIRLNARGKPLTDLEHFKAQLLDRMREQSFPCSDEFERRFDGVWTDFFWNYSKEKNTDFDRIYYTFFGVLLMNHGIIQDDKSWIHTLDFKKIDIDLFYAAYHTLNFLCRADADPATVSLLIRALRKDRSYTDRVLFHAVSVCFLKTDGVIQKDSLNAWIRILKNLVLNTEIDNLQRYRRAIDGTDGMAGACADILNYFVKKKEVTGFNQQQIEEERIKAAIITADPSFADAIFKAEQHPYFSGQIRSALYLSQRPEDHSYDKHLFAHYWKILSALFGPDKPRYEPHLLRRALLTLGDYTLPVSQFRTLCVDDPNETANTPSMKALFSKCEDITKKLLDQMDPDKDIKAQLEQLVNASSVSKTDWRYCFIQYPELFRQMSDSHLRLRRINQEIHMIPNKWSNGRNYDVFLSALYQELKKRKISSEFDNELGTYVQHCLYVKEKKGTVKTIVTWTDHKYHVKNTEQKIIFTSQTEDPIEETADYLETFVKCER